MATVKRAPAKHSLSAADLHALSEIATRAALASRLGKSYSDKRDLYTALGYIVTPLFADFMARYKRQDIARAAVDIPVRACWRKPPEVYESQDDDETLFEVAWNELCKDRKVFHYLSRVDRLACIGKHAVLFMGFDDGATLDKPVERATQLLYMMPYSEDNAVIKSYVEDEKDPRFGLPLTYQLAMRQGKADRTFIVHASRVIHVIEDPLDSDIEGQPALEAILNRLHDLELLSGGSAEMFWRGAFPGVAFKLDADAQIQGQDLDALKVQIENYVHGLQRYMRTQGMTVEELAQQIADPSKHIDAQLDLICAARRIPKRILLGSERGELASTQDEENWSARVEERQLEQCEAMILRPFIDRMTELGVLPEPAEDYTVEWPPLVMKGDKEKAEIGLAKTQALAAYAGSVGAETIIPPDVFLEKFLDLTPEEIELVTATLEGIDAELAREPEVEPQPVIGEPAFATTDELARMGKDGTA